jgi:nicotinamidase/pyrazinamidase
MGKSNRALVIVDPQNDFCDRMGSLYVEGAYGDIKRLSKHIKSEGGRYSDIFLSLDSHDRTAIFHPAFWIGDNGAAPAPLTRITKADFESGRWCPKSDEYRTAAERTFAAMDEKGEEFLMIWPEHCIVSTWGHQISGDLPEALDAWRRLSGRAVRYIFKGENPYTDQFSIFEGVDGSYPETRFNEPLFEALSSFESVTFAGEALSHCVGESILSYLGRPGHGDKTYLLSDCTSPVGGFDRDEWLAKLKAAGTVFLDSSKDFK